MAEQALAVTVKQLHRCMGAECMPVSKECTVVLSWITLNCRWTRLP